MARDGVRANILEYKINTPMVLCYAAYFEKKSKLNLNVKKKNS